MEIKRECVGSELQIELIGFLLNDLKVFELEPLKKEKSGRYHQVCSVDWGSRLLLTGGRATPVEGRQWWDGNHVLERVARIAYGQDTPLRLGLVEVVWYPPSTGSCPMHVDCVPGRVCVVSLGCSADFEWRQGKELQSTTVWSGDVCSFSGDASYGLSHGVKAVFSQESRPAFLPLFQGRFIVQYRLAPPPPAVSRLLDKIGHSSQHRSIDGLKERTKMNAVEPLWGGASAEWGAVAQRCDARSVGALACVSRQLCASVDRYLEKEQKCIGFRVGHHRNYATLPRPDDEMYRALVVEPGSRYHRLGVAGDDAPRCVYDSALAADPARASDLLVGPLAFRSNFPSFPVHRGVVTDWEQEMALLDWGLQKLDYRRGEDAVLVTEPPLNPKANREKMCQIMFEDFECGAYYTCSTGALTVYASGNSTGLHVDCAFQCTRIVPVYEGYTLPAHVIEIPRDADDDDQAQCQEIVQNVCHLLGVESEGKPCPRCIANHPVLDEECRKDVFPRIVLVGGRAAPGSTFQTLLFRALMTSFPSGCGAKVIRPPEGLISCWLGGSILGSLSTFKGMWISKEEYDESGPSIVHRKCF